MAATIREALTALAIDDDSAADDRRDAAYATIEQMRKNRLLRYLHSSHPRGTYSDLCKIDTISVLHGIWRTKRWHVWTYHETPMRHFLLYNASRESLIPPRTTLTFPSASWFDYDGASPPPPICSLWDDYARWMASLALKALETKYCTSCSGYCWRVTPHVELADFTNRPILEAWARFAERDTPSVLNLFVLMGASCLLEQCECRNCWAESVRIIRDWRARTSSLPTVADTAIAQAATIAGDYDFVAEKRLSTYFWTCLLRNTIPELRNWHTGNLGCVLRWLLERHIDATRYSAEIDSAFEQLYRMGSTNLALALGMYASRAQVQRSVAHFCDIHEWQWRNEESLYEECANRCFRSPIKKAVHMLIGARGLARDSRHRELAVCVVEQRAAVLMRMDRPDLADEHWPLQSVESTRSATQRHPWREFLIDAGLARFRAVPMPSKQLSDAALRVRAVCDRLYVTEFMRRVDSVLGSWSHLLGRCDPCSPTRPIGNPANSRVPWHARRFDDAYESSAAERDTGVPSGAVERDSGVPSGAAERDSGVPSGAAERDSGVPSGAAERDSGTAERDSGTAESDVPSGTVESDVPSGTTESDAPSDVAERDVPSGTVERMYDG